MPAISYDLITIGGGLGGASLAKAMADRGACGYAALTLLPAGADNFLAPARGARPLGGDVSLA